MRTLRVHALNTTAPGIPRSGFVQRGVLGTMLNLLRMLLRAEHDGRHALVIALGQQRPPLQKAPGSDPQLRWGRALLVAGLLALLLFLAIWLLFRESTEDALAGSWTIEPESAQAYYPLQVSQTGMTLDFRRDGTFLLHFADETTSGKWRITRKETDNVTVTLSIPGEPPGEVLLQGSDSMLSTFPGQGTFPLRRSSSIVHGMRPLIGPSVALKTPATSSGSNSANYSLIEEHLYMGGAVSQPPPGTLATLNLNQSNDSWRSEVYDWIPIPDASPAPTLDWLQQRVDFVSSNRASGRTTFVHCAAGKSRSGLVTVAYVMSEHHWSRNRALAFVRSRRPQTNPNSAFMDLLSKWEQLLGTRRNGAANAGLFDFALDDDDEDED
jgi:Dual specificity phosphatase, catalytic domain